MKKRPKARRFGVSKRGAVRPRTKASSLMRRRTRRRR